MREDSGVWGREMSSIRIVVTIPTGIYPELIADLAQVQLRDRAERLRMLAMLGLRDAQRTLGAKVTESRGSSPPATENPDAIQRDSTNKLIRRLTDSL
jgi:hypothetical protein